MYSFAHASQTSLMKLKKAISGIELKMQFPILSQAKMLLAPIIQSFQVKISGTPEKPKWDLKLTPLGLFKKKGFYRSDDFQTTTFFQGPTEGFTEKNIAKSAANH